MKKQLLCTSAIALGVAAAPAAAQDWNLDWGGFFNAHVAFVDAGGTLLAPVAAPDFDGVAFLNTGEIIFTPSVTLDNGLTFGVNVQFEAQNSGSTTFAANTDVDESFISISSDTFGRLLLGAENSAGYLLSTGASGVTSLSTNSPSISAFIPVSAVGGGGLTRSAFASSFTEVARNNDLNRITYFTPDFNGLTIGVSYARNNNGNLGSTGPFAPPVGGQANATVIGNLEDIFDIGANYSGSFGSTDVVLSARYGSADLNVPGATASDPDTWAIGANVTFGSVTVGGSYAENGNVTAAAAAIAAIDVEGWSLGITYDVAGPWTVGLSTYQGEAENFAGVTFAEYENYKLGASRQLGAGVAWDLYLVYAEADNPLVLGTQVDGTIVGTGISLSF